MLALVARQTWIAKPDERLRGMLVCLMATREGHVFLYPLTAARIRVVRFVHWIFAICTAANPSGWTMLRGKLLRQRNRSCECSGFLRATKERNGGVVKQTSTSVFFVTRRVPALAVWFYRLAEDHLPLPREDRGPSWTRASWTPEFYTGRPAERVRRTKQGRRR
ncbi:uncharacterized protein LOC142771649 [Rhipicephalus microplus]|uniref:uncharacterized protein LOC142771649 n=1 Tax=Rhipicephalus microplus TaxID=6941 RepID=UPI003F6CCCEE